MSLAAVSAEAPLGGGGGYSYSRPSGGFGGGFGGGHGGGHGGGGGGALIPVAPGPSTNEGQHVDGQILEQVRQIILKDEAATSTVHGGGGGFGGGYPSSSYGVPSSSYGVPSSSYGVPSHHYVSRVVGVDLEGIKQALQVAQYEQHGGYASGGGYSYPAPSGSYGVPSRPSGSYGVPF